MIQSKNETNLGGEKLKNRLFSKLLILELLILLPILISSCGSPEPQEIEVIKEVTRIVTVEVTNVVLETVEVPVTVTPSSTPRYTPTITQTATITPTATNTMTFTPTVTNTKAPGVGTVLNCGDYFTIVVTEQPRKEPLLYGERAIGEFWFLKMDITNFMGESFDLNEDDFIIEAELDGRRYEFEASWDATWEWVYHHYGQLIYPWDDLVAGLSASVGIGFDVNPNATNYKLVWFPRDNMFDDRYEALCEVTIPLD